MDRIIVEGKIFYENKRPFNWISFMKDIQLPVASIFSFVENLICEFTIGSSMEFMFSKFLNNFLL